MSNLRELQRIGSGHLDSLTTPPRLDRWSGTERPSGKTTRQDSKALVFRAAGLSHLKFLQEMYQHDLDEADLLCVDQAAVVRTHLAADSAAWLTTQRSARASSQGKQPLMSNLG